MSYVVRQPNIVDFHLTFVTAQHNVQNFSGFVNLRKNVPDFFIHITLLIDSGNENFDLMYLNKTFSLCNFLKNKKSNLFIGIVFEVMSKYTELPKGCPLVTVSTNINLFNTKSD